MDFMPLAPSKFGICKLPKRPTKESVGFQIITAYA